MLEGREAVSRGVSAWIAGEWKRGRMRVRGPCVAISPVQAGEAGEGPGRENSLASLSTSLTNSLSHTSRTGVTRRSFQSL